MTTRFRKWGAISIPPLSAGAARQGWVDCPMCWARVRLTGGRLPVHLSESGQACVRNDEMTLETAEAVAALRLRAHP